MSAEPRVRVCHVSTVHKPFDTRIFHKECRSLAAAGYDVHWVVRNPDDVPERDGVTLHRIPIFRRRLFRMTVGVALALLRVIRLRPGLVHLHDPELLPLGLVCRTLGMRVIFDMHELVARQLEDKTYMGGTAIRWAGRFYRWMERRAMQRFDGIVLAEDGYVPYIEEHYPAHRAKAHVVRNYPLLGKAADVPAAPRTHDGPLVVYTGGLTRIRGIAPLIQAVGQVENARLLLAGPWESEAYRAECLGLPEAGRVDDLGFLSLEDVFATLKSADVGVAMIAPLPNYLTSRPVKVYEYMSCGIATVISDFPGWQETFGDVSWFATFEDVPSTAAAIRRALDDPDRAERIERARARVQAEWNWDVEQERLLELYRRILG